MFLAITALPAAAVVLVAVSWWVIAFPRAGLEAPVSLGVLTWLWAAFALGHHRWHAWRGGLRGAFIVALGMVAFMAVVLSPIPGPPWWGACLAAGLATAGAGVSTRLGTAAP